jgi:Protein of unknown function (DUF4232)
MRARWIPVVVLPVALAAACGNDTVQGASATPPPGSSSSDSTVTASSGGAPAPCTTNHLSVKLGPQGGAAGSTYASIVFTNNGTATCTLRGYPGVSYLGTQGTQRVGAPASRNTLHTVATVTLAAGASSAALLQRVNPANYDATACKPVAVSALRVYPPGATQPADVSLPSGATACSGSVDQLTVTAVVAGTTGQ